MTTPEDFTSLAEKATPGLSGGAKFAARVAFEIVARVCAINENKTDSIPFVCACRFICYLCFFRQINNRIH